MRSPLFPPLGQIKRDEGEERFAPLKTNLSQVQRPEDLYIGDSICVSWGAVTDGSISWECFHLIREAFVLIAWCENAMQQ